MIMAFKFGGKDLPQVIEQTVLNKIDPSFLYRYDCYNEIETSNITIIESLCDLLQDMSEKIFNMEERIKLLERPYSVKFIQDD